MAEIVPSDEDAHWLKWHGEDDVDAQGSTPTTEINKATAIQHGIISGVDYSSYPDLDEDQNQRAARIRERQYLGRTMRVPLLDARPAIQVIEVGPYEQIPGSNQQQQGEMNG